MFAKSDTERNVSEAVARARKLDLQSALDIAAQWQPDGAFYSYREEMASRLDYYYSNMQGDVATQLERKFPQTYADFYKDQVNVPILKWLTTKKAQVFSGGGRVWLSKGGEAIPEDDPRQLALDDMIFNSNFWAVLQRADAYVEAFDRTACKVWFDEERKCASASVWPPHSVHIVPDPLQPWNIELAESVLFETSGVAVVDGRVVGDSVYEVWSRFADDRADTHGMTSLHYTTSEHRPHIKWTNDDQIPFIDPRTKDAMYPFVWLNGDGLCELYRMSNSDLLALNRSVNIMLTDIRYGYHFNIHPMSVIRLAPGAQSPGRLVVGPGDVVEMPDGCELEFVTPDSNSQEATQFVHDIVRMAAQIDGVSAKALFSDDGQPESGVSLEIRDRDIARHNKAKELVYIPQIKSLVYKMAVVNDHYAGEFGMEQILRDPEIEIDLELFGDTGVVDESKQVSDISAKIGMRVMARHEARMELNGESEDEARSAIEEIDSDNQAMFDDEPKEEEDRAEADDAEKDAGKSTEKDQSSAPSDVREATNQLSKVNVYQIAKAIEQNAATAIDMRMLLFGEDRESATRRVAESAKINEEMQKALAEKQAIMNEAEQGTNAVEDKSGDEEPSE